MHPFRALVEMLRHCLHKVAFALEESGYKLWSGYWWLRVLRVELWLVEGEEQSSGLPLSILCSLRAQDKNHFLQMVFGDSYRQRSLGRFWLWNVLTTTPPAEGDYSMIVAGSFESHLKFANPDEWFHIPAWLLGRVDLPYDGNVTGKFSRELRRRIRRHGFQYEVTRDPQQFDDFYHNMYVGYITRTYGNRAELDSYKSLRAVFRSGVLLLVKNREESVAGLLIGRGRGAPLSWALGVRDGDRDYVKDGVASALYHFCFQYLHEQGHTSAFLGWSRGFLRDGVLQFKKRLSQRIVDHRDRGFAIKVLSHTPATKAFLCNNPFVFKRHNVLYAAVFVDGDTPLCCEEVKQIDKDYFHPGLSRLVIYCLRPEQALTSELVPAELSDHIVVRCGGNASELCISPA